MKNKITDQAQISGFTHDGRGIATANRKKLFIHGALPGETVEYEIIKKSHRYSEASVIQVLNSAPHRIIPECQHFGVCGGCSLQHLHMNAQLAFKQEMLLEQLLHFGKIKPLNLLPPLISEQWGYRHKARLGVKFVIKKNKLIIGFREKNSKYLADIAVCQVLHPRVGKQLNEMRELIASLSQYHTIPQIEVAVGDDAAALVFRHLTPLPQEDLQKLISFGQQFDFHIYTQPNPPLPLIKHWPNDTCDRLSYRLPDEQLCFHFHPLDFTQIHLAMNKLMVKQALDVLSLSPQDIVLDLFSGIGNFTLPIAKHAQHVVGIEGSEEMVSRGYENAKLNQIHNVQFFAENLMAAPKQRAWQQYRYNKILLDPPRAGAKEILPFIGQSMAEKIVYISCNPATLARDAGQLVHQYAYQLTNIGVINMFPHTSHTEAMAVFVKK